MLNLWLYQLATWLVPQLPERFGYWLFARIGDIAYVFGGQARANYQKNLRHVVGPNLERREFERLTRKAFQNLLKNYYDLFRGHRLTEAQVYAQLESVQGLEYLDAAVAREKGVAGGTAHFGNFNMFLHLTAVYLKRKVEVVVPVERIKPESVFQIVSRQRAAQGIELVPVEQAARVLIKKLRAGAVLGLAIDRDITRSGPIIDFFGAPAQLPDGAAALALKYDAPLVLAFVRRLENNKCAVVIEPPLPLERTGDLAQDTRRGVVKIAERMEYWISRYPEQWILFQPLWESDK